VEDIARLLGERFPGLDGVVSSSVALSFNAFAPIYLLDSGDFFAFGTTECIDVSDWWLDSSELE
jgi:hypothetical protein